MSLRHIYLEKGHTMMGVDSVRSNLEAYFKPPINFPSDYITRMRLARPAQPFKFNVLHFDFWRNYESRRGLVSLWPRRTVGGSKVIDTRHLRFTANGNIEYNLGQGDKWDKLPLRRKSVLSTIEEVSQLYT